MEDEVSLLRLRLCRGVDRRNWEIGMKSLVRRLSILVGEEKRGVRTCWRKSCAESGGEQKKMAIAMLPLTRCSVERSNRECSEPPDALAPVPQRLSKTRWEWQSSELPTSQQLDYSCAAARAVDCTMVCSPSTRSNRSRTRTSTHPREISE